MDNSKKPGRTGMSRRGFIGLSATAAAGFSIVPRTVLGGPGFTPPSDMVNVAGIGIGGMGKNNVSNCKDIANIYALCDVDHDYAAPVFKEYPKAKIYQDFRKLLENEQELDAVIIATPDHTHAVIAAMAMKAGKHVYCQKPLTYSIYEARRLAEIAKETGVVTQMGNQGHASEDGRLICEWIAAGAIGNVTEVHCWTNRPVWPQGNINRPKEIPSVPATLDWNLWLGPAPFKPYHPDVCHFVWRGWRDYGTGALGDMGAHIIDHPYWALNLSAPKSVEASSTEYSDDAYPEASYITYEFAARGNVPPLKLYWSDGGITPSRPDVLEDGRRMGTGGSGVIYYGDKGAMMHGTYGRGPRLIPEAAMRDFKRPEPTIPRSPGIEAEWIEAIKDRSKKTTTHFGYSGPLTETMLLGNVAVFMQDANTRLYWDSKNMKVTNNEEANKYVGYDYRTGWSL
jgi:predicted dehydrogenase